MKYLTALEFFILLNLFAIPAFFIHYSDVDFPLLRAAEAKIVALFLGKAENHFVYVNGYAFNISRDSTAWKSLWLFFSLMIISIFLKGLNAKDVAYLLIGLLIIFFANILRIITTIRAALAYGFAGFKIVHTFLWREGMIFLVLALWFLWLTKNVYYLKSKILFRCFYGRRGKASYGSKSRRRVRRGTNPRAKS